MKPASQISYSTSANLSSRSWLPHKCIILHGETEVTPWWHLYWRYRVTYTTQNTAQWQWMWLHLGTSWWRHQMETFSALLAICAENSPVPGEFPAQRPVTRSFDVFFDLRLNKRLSKQWWGWWFETLSHSLWRHRNVIPRSQYICSKICISFQNQVKHNTF